jgi:hypothetical protein
MSAAPSNDPEWWNDIFGEREASRMRADMEAVAEEYDDETEQLEIRIVAPIDTLEILLPTIKEYCEQVEASHLKDFLMTVGQGLSYQYLINPDIDFADDLSECADFFQANLIDGLDFDDE